MHALVRRTTIAAITATFLLGTTTAATSDPDASSAAKIRCASSTSNGKTFYKGKSASYKYDERFSRGPYLSKAELAKFTPQGAAWWKNWDGNKDLLLVTAYDEDAKASHLVGLDPNKPGKDATVGTVRIDKSHVGGVAVHGKWAFVSGPGRTIQKYRLSDLAAALKKGKPGTPDKVKIDPVGADRAVYGSSFLSVYGDHLYAGRFNEDGRDKMYRYKIGDDGSLTTEGGAWEIPTKTQGVLVTKGHFIYSTSAGRKNRSNIYSVDSGPKDLDKASPYCFRAPSMAEGITATPGGSAYLLFESGSHQYRNARNVIPGLHRAKLSDLTSLTSAGSGTR